MFLKYLFISLIILLLASPLKANESTALAIATYSSPPYQYLENNKVQGSSIYTLQCIFSKLEKTVAFDIYPLQRALHLLTNNEINGVFPVHSANTEQRKHSAPIAIEKWYWITNFPLDANTIIADNKRVGAVNGSPAYFWLKENNTQIDTLVTTQAQLLDMFKVGRLDAIIIDGNETNKDIKFHRSLNTKAPYWRFIKFEPHHLVFSHNTLVNSPNLLSQFNQKISTCQPSSLATNTHEKELLKTYLKHYLKQLTAFLAAHTPLPKLNVQAFAPNTNAIEARWNKEVLDGEGDLYDYQLKSELAVFLANLQQASNGGIAEILLIEPSGYAIALSQPTTDLYQGDEDQFLKTFPYGKGAVFVSDIRYDDSTHAYQSQVSFTLSNTLGQPLGVVTFGVNIEKILLGQKFTNNRSSPLILHKMPLAIN